MLKELGIIWMQVGQCAQLEQIAGTWYYLHSGGNMAIGWLKDNNQWYYFKFIWSNVT